MYQDDYYNDTDICHDVQEFANMVEREKRKDRGYNVVYRRAVRRDNTPYQKRIEVYTSGGTGSQIRDAETGNYFANKVGSPDEDLFFKVVLATGECTSANGSSTLFFVSPQHYATHMVRDITHVTGAYGWEQKRDNRLRELNQLKRPQYAFVEVK